MSRLGKKRIRLRVRPSVISGTQKRCATKLLEGMVVRCRAWGCTSCRRPLASTGWTTSFPLPLMQEIVSQEKLEGYQDRRQVRRCLLPLPLSTSFSCPKRSHADTMLAIFERTLRTAIVVTRSFQFCGRIVRTSEGQALPPHAGLILGSESLQRARGGARLSRLVPTDPADLGMPRTARGTTRAGEKRR